jgi:hypothetical protein
VAKFTRKGLHRLECPMCGAVGYFTIAPLEQRGFPPCWCGASFEPGLELALHLGADTAAVAEYRAKCNSVAHGQVSHIANGHECDSPEFRALYGSDKEIGLLERERQETRARRLAAIGHREMWISPGSGKRKQRVVLPVSSPEPMPF